jgi:hypothetical protein
MSAATPRTVPIADLLSMVPHLRAGALALRERERWAARVAFLRLDAQQAARHAVGLEALVRLIGDPRDRRVGP